MLMYKCIRRERGSVDREGRDVNVSMYKERERGSIDREGRDVNV